MGQFVGVFYLFLPLLGGGVLHGLAMKGDWWPGLRRPLDGGWSPGGRRLFGANKTFRGPLVVGLGTALVCGLQTDLLHHWAPARALELVDYGQVNGWLFGFALGVAAMLGELPNSFLKRRLGVAPGTTTPRPLLKPVFYLLDQVDLFLGAWPVAALAVTPSLSRVLLSLLLGVLLHQGLTTVTHAFGMRRSAR